MRRGKCPPGNVEGVEPAVFFARAPLTPDRKQKGRVGCKNGYASFNHRCWRQKSGTTETQTAASLSYITRQMGIFYPTRARRTKKWGSTGILPRC